MQQSGCEDTSCEDAGISSPYDLRDGDIEAATSAYNPYHKQSSTGDQEEGGKALTQRFVYNLPQILYQLEEDVQSAHLELQEIEEELHQQEQIRKQMIEAYVDFEKDLAERRKSRFRFIAERDLSAEEEEEEEEWIQQSRNSWQDYLVPDDSFEALAPTHTTHKVSLFPENTIVNDRTSHAYHKGTCPGTRVVRLDLGRPPRKSLWKFLSKSFVSNQSRSCKQKLRRQADVEKEKATRWTLYKELDVSEVQMDAHFRERHREGELLRCKRCSDYEHAPAYSERIDRLSARN